MTNHTILLIQKGTINYDKFWRYGYLDRYSVQKQYNDQKNTSKLAIKNVTLLEWLFQSSIVVFDY